MQPRTDKELLEDYVASADEAAFEELVSRHGPTVYRVCRGILRDAHAAEDASQATFMVLVKKAGRLRRHEELSAWLCGVARTTALMARRTRTHRARREKVASVLHDRDDQGEHEHEHDAAARSEQIGEVYEALAALPAAQCQAVVLRYLKGHSQEEAARLAVCPVGTLKQRASRGLARLRDQLSKRGLALGVVALAGILETEAHAAVPETLLPSLMTASKAAAATAAAGAVGSHAVALSEGVIRMMLLAKIKTVLLGSCVALLLGVGASLTLWSAVARGRSAEPPRKTVAQKQLGGPVVNGLQVILRMDKDVIRDGEAWTGKVYLRNAGAKPLSYYKGVVLDVKLVDGNGKPAKTYAALYRGELPTREEIRKNIEWLQPGDQAEIAAFRQAGATGAYIDLQYPGMLLAGWRLAPGKDYRLQVKTSVDSKYASGLGIDKAWTGTAASNEAKVRVQVVDWKAPTVNGLQMILGVNDSFARGDAVGQFRFRNLTRKPIVVDTGVGFYVSIYDAHGRELPGQPAMRSWPSSRAGKFLTIPPGETVFCQTTFSCSEMKITPVEYREAPPGTYRVAATYICNKDEAAKHGVKGTVWQGTIASNTVEFTVPERKKSGEGDAF
jgi:RNA polymerase sigma factor (sigma-70 family)